MKNEIPVLIALWVLIPMLPVKAQNLPGKVVYPIPGMNTVEVRVNLAYRKAGPDELKMDIYLPPKLAANERRPVVLLSMADQSHQRAYGKHSDRARSRSNWGDIGSLRACASL